MKITNSPTTVSKAIAAYQERTPNKVSRQSSAQNPSSSMNVELSPGSQAIHDASNDIDMAKVQAIREALANGTLKINPDRIASGLIQSAAELLE